MKPHYGIVGIRHMDDRTVVEVDTTQAKYKGIPWKELGSYGKRKFENLLVLEKPKERVLAYYL